MHKQFVFQQELDDDCYKARCWINTVDHQVMRVRTQMETIPTDDITFASEGNCTSTISYFFVHLLGQLDDQISIKKDRLRQLNLGELQKSLLKVKGISQSKFKMRQVATCQSNLKLKLQF